MQQALPTILVIVGVTGDLSKRKLIPSLYNLERDNLLPTDFKIVGTTRRQLSVDNLFESVEKHLDKKNIDSKAIKRLKNRIRIVQLDLTQKECYRDLTKVLADLENNVDSCTGRLFYLAVPPGVMPVISDLVGREEVHRCIHGDMGRILIEKPFGRDLASAQELSDILSRHFKEEQIYRIDHYLAKETTQNIIHFRFNNPLIEDLWNNRFIDHIRIVATEAIGIEGRANFYENTGALRDMVQSHLLQLLALITMTRPKSFLAEDIRKEREKVLSEVRIYDDQSTDITSIRGQYQGYREEVNNPVSDVETYVELKVEVDNEKWHGVPIYIVTGKGLDKKSTEISLVYKGEEIEDINTLTIRVQPDEGISLRLRAKKPGLDSELKDIAMSYNYQQSEDHIKHTAYEKLIVDAMRGNQRLFPSTSEVLNSWKYVDDILNGWKSTNKKLLSYKRGSTGPVRLNKRQESNKSKL